MRVAFAVLILGALQEDQVVPLFRELESADLRKVYHAVADLAALGDPALPAIQARLKEARGRTREYLELAESEIRSARMFAGLPPYRRLSMKSSDRNVVELLGDLRAKTGVALSLENLMGEEKLPEIPVEIHDATMLEVFDAICRAGNVGVAMENGQFMLYPGDYQDVPRFFYDRYLFRLQSFKLMKTVDFRRKADQSFRIQMEMLWDPAAAPCKFGTPVLIDAVDDKGRCLIPPSASPAPPKPRQEEPTEEPEPEATSELKLLPPSPGSEKIAVLRGLAPIGLPKTRVTVSFTEDPKRRDAPHQETRPQETAETVPAFEGTIRKNGDFTVKLTKVEAGLFRISAEVTSTTLRAAEVAKMPFLAKVTLKGGDMTRTFVSPWNATDEAAEVLISFQPLHVREVLVKPGEDRPAPPPVIEKIEFSIVTAVQERKIPFEFRDLKIK